MLYIPGLRTTTTNKIQVMAHGPPTVQ